MYPTLMYPTLSLLTSLFVATTPGFSRMTPVIPLASQTSYQAGYELSNLAAPALVAQNVSTRRIEFAPGASSATVSSSAIRGERLIYSLGVRRGQTINIAIESSQANGGALFTIISPDGTVIDNGLSRFTTEATRSGDYQISVGGSRGNASFQLTVEVR